MGVCCLTLSANNAANVNAQTDLYVVDSIGELKMFYAAAVGVPVLFGSYMINFKEIADGVLKQKAAIQCQTTEDVVQAVLTLYQQPDYRAELIAKGKAFIRDNQGTVTRICELFEAALRH